MDAADENSCDSDGSEGWLIVSSDGPNLLVKSSSRNVESSENILLDECFEITERNVAGPSKVSKGTFVDCLSGDTSPTEKEGVDGKQTPLDFRSCLPHRKSIDDNIEIDENVSGDAHSTLDNDICSPCEEGEEQENVDNGQLAPSDEETCKTSNAESKLGLKNSAPESLQTSGTQTPSDDRNSQQSTLQLNYIDIFKIRNEVERLWARCEWLTVLIAVGFTVFYLAFQIHVSSREDEREALNRVEGDLLALQYSISLLKAEKAVLCQKLKLSSVEDKISLEKEIEGLGMAVYPSPSIAEGEPISDSTNAPHDENVVLKQEVDEASRTEKPSVTAGTESAELAAMPLVGTTLPGDANADQLLIEDTVTSADIEDVSQTTPLRDNANKRSAPGKESLVGGNLQLGQLIPLFYEYASKRNIQRLVNIAEGLENVVSDVKEGKLDTESNVPLYLKMSAAITKLLRSSKEQDVERFEQRIFSLADKLGLLVNTLAGQVTDSVGVKPSKKDPNIIQWYSSDEEEDLNSIFVKEADSDNEKHGLRNDCMSDYCDINQQRHESSSKNGECHRHNQSNKYLKPKEKERKVWKKANKFERSGERFYKIGVDFSKEKGAWLLERGKARNDLRVKGGKNRYFKSTGMLVS